VGHGQDEAEDGSSDEDACLEAAEGCAACGGLDDNGEVGVDRVLGVRAGDGFLRGLRCASIIIPAISMQHSDGRHKKSLSDEARKQPPQRSLTWQAMG
jgi:hypothetical protein